MNHPQKHRTDKGVFLQIVGCYFCMWYLLSQILFVKKKQTQKIPQQKQNQKKSSLSSHICVK